MQEFINKPQIKVLYANGDSFGFGQELDGPRTPSNFYHFSDYQRQHCYSGVIANRLGVDDYINESLPGGSNQRIYRTTLNTVTNLLEKYRPDEIFVLVSLTHNHRREFYRNEYKKYHPHMATHKPSGDGYLTEFWKIMVTNFHHPIGDHDLDQQMILGLQNFLRINRVPYLFTWSMHHGAIYEEEEKFVTPMILKQRYARRFLQKPSFAYYVFQELKTQKAPEGHPLTDGHLAWADYIENYININDLWGNSDLLS